MKNSKVYVKAKLTRIDRAIQILALFLKGRFYYWGLKSILYMLVDRAVGQCLIKVGKNTKIHPTAVIREGKNVQIGSNCMINHGCVLHGGKRNAKVLMGNYVQLGPYVTIFCFDHDIRIRNKNMMVDSFSEADVTISDNVWIGAGSVITAGVKIGSGAVIGAGSIITKDVAKNSIVAGVAASHVRLRGDD